MAPEENQVGRNDVGTFVRTGLGIGRLVAMGETTAHVRYFEAPGRTPYVERTHENGAIRRTMLPTHTRTYLYDGRRWRIGRVDGIHPQDPTRYLIAFPNSRGAVLPSEAFDVRWSVPITNPFDVLESVGGDSPVVYESRLGFLSAWAKQRAAATGVEGLVLGSVGLYRHQLEVVRRVAADPVKRYLLADEVGLGKTIEAAALIWQFLATHPNGRVLILAPDNLRQQWATELLDRFRTGHYPNAWLRIRSQTNETSWPHERVDMLVIDEAHHVTRTGSLSMSARERIAWLAHQAESLLLLSATPVRSNEAGFLDLLHLLDPDHYQPDQLDAFVTRVELRDQLALTYQGLVPTIDGFDLSLYADELRRLFPQDLVLCSSLDDAVAADDEARPEQVERVRAYLSDTYRLHHRLLRTRRTPEVGSTFAVRGRRRAVPFTLEVTDRADGLRRELLDSVRGHLIVAVETGTLTLGGAVDVLKDVAARSGSLSHALLPLSETLGADDPGSSAQRFFGSVDDYVREGWRAIIDEIHAAHVPLLDELGAVLSRSTVARGLARVVIFSSFTQSARVVAQEVVRRWGSDRVAIHAWDQDRDKNVSEVDRWRNDGPCSILLCDSSAEEGINLQSAELLIHLDLPWDTFRVEQRIGRCDRHADSNSGPIPSTVVVLGDQPYALAWFEFLADGCKVFERSVSSLQYVLSDTENAVQEAVLGEGPTALTEAVATQAMRLDQEKIRIVAHDALDSIDRSGSSLGDSLFDALLESDRNPALASALTAWFEGVGVSMRHPTRGAILLDRKPRPQVPFNFEVSLAPFLDTTLALERTVAVERGLPLLRAGHPLMDAIASQLRDSDRGVAFAMFRPARGQWPPVVVLRTDFFVSLHPEATFSAEAVALRLDAWLNQTISEVAPPLVETVVLANDGSEIRHPALREPYDMQRGDQNLGSRPDLFEQLTANIEWSATCDVALARARARLSERPSVTERPRTAAARLRSRLGQLADRERARALAGLESDGKSWDQLAVMAPNELGLQIDVMGCGVIFVGDPTRLA